MERGTVRMRVAFVLRSAEVQPLFRDLCEILSSLLVLIRQASSSPLFSPNYQANVNVWWELLQNLTVKEMSYQVR